MQNYWRFVADNRRWLLGGVLLTLFSSVGQTFFISLFGAEIRTEFALSHGEFGALYMLATLASAVTLTQLGRILDHLSLRQTLCLVLPCLALAATVMAWSSALWTLLLALFLLRLFGQGMMTHTALTTMARWYAGQRGRAVSLVSTGHQWGEAVFPSLMVLVLGWLSWRQAWLLAASSVILVLPWVLWLWRVPRQPLHTDPPSQRSASRDWTRQEVLRDWRFWALCMVVLAPSFIGTTIFFHQDYLSILRGWPAQTFAQAFVLMASMTIVFGLISGMLIDRYSAVFMLPFFLLPLSLACFALWAFTASWGAYIFMAVLGVSYGFSSSLFGALWPELYGLRHLGGIRALIMAFMVLGTALGPGLTGVLIDIGVAYPKQILAMGAYCMVASALMLWMRRLL